MSMASSKAFRILSLDGGGNDLKALGINCARAEEKRIRLRFLDRLAAPFEPSRAA